MTGSQSPDGVRQNEVKDTSGKLTVDALATLVAGSIQKHGPLAQQDIPVTWAVYLMTIYKQTDRIAAVCEQREWDAIERARPGYHRLIRGGIASEVEAEMLARSDSSAGMAPAIET
jgi:hypothetical protein